MVPCIFYHDAICHLSLCIHYIYLCPGKNDGQVAGVRYFQCEPRRGVFSRLTRLTRAPLQEADEESVTGGPGNGMKTSNGGPGSGLMSPRGSHTPLLSPAGSVKELVLKKPPTTLSESDYIYRNSNSNAPHFY